MSLESIRVRDLSEDENALVNRLLEQLADKAQRNELRAAYYDHKHVVRAMSPVVPPQYYKIGLVLGWTAKAVDALARRMNFDAMVWPDGDVGSLGLRELSDGNNLKGELNAGLVSMLIHSVGFLINTKGDESAGEPKSLMHFKDALNATGEWNARTRRLKNLLSVTSRDKDGNPDSMVLYLDGVTIPFSRTLGVWSVQDRQAHPWGLPAEVLPYQPRPSRPFGSSRISRPIMSLNDAGVRSLVRLEGHSDVFSYPEFWMLGAGMDMFKNPDGSQKANWEVMLGRIKGIPDNEDSPDGGNARADVKQFPASSPEPHLAQVNAYAKLFAREASLPDSSIAISDLSNPTSAESYDAAQYELIAEAEGATDDCTNPVARWVRRGLAIQNELDVMPAQWASMDPKWRDPRFLSRAAEADAGSKQLGAVPWLADTSVGLELLGLSQQQAERAMAERRRAAGRELIANLTAQAAAPAVVAPDGGVA